MLKKTIHIPGHFSSGATNCKWDLKDVTVVEFENALHGNTVLTALASDDTHRVHGSRFRITCSIDGLPEPLLKCYYEVKDSATTYTYGHCRSWCFGEFVNASSELTEHINLVLLSSSLEKI